MLNKIKKVLEENYNIKVTNVKETQGGWAALAFVVETNNCKYFLKLYDMSRASSVTYTKYIDGYVKVLLKLKDLRENITIPILTKKHMSFVEENNYIYLLLEYIDGETIREKKLTDNDKIELSHIINKLHSTRIDATWKLPKEDFIVDTAIKLKQFLNKPIDNQIFEILKPYFEYIISIIDSIEKIAVEYKNKPIEYVLCHTDIHTYNIMKNKKHLWLVDWEGLKISPKENDLALLNNENGQFILNNYYNKNVDAKLMKYYSNKRKIDDIWEWIELLVVDNNNAKREEYIKSLEQELKDIKK